jgi:Ca2+-binding EF-hand superfamily protein
MVGNEASIDDQGFIRPFRALPDCEEEKARQVLNKYVRDIPAIILKEGTSLVGLHASQGPLGATATASDGIGGRSRRLPPPGPGGSAPACCLEGLMSLSGHMPPGAGGAFSSLEKGGGIKGPWGTLERDVQCCWLCERWVEQKVSYVPGLSGPERPDDVREVFAYFSIDRFQLATPLVRTEEAPTRKMLHSMIGSRSSRVSRDFLKTDPSEFPRTPSGRVVRWIGSRMLPPSSEPVEVVFQVNDRFVVASHLPSKALRPARDLVLQGSAGKAPRCRTLPAKRANVLTVATAALEQMRRSPGCFSLASFEDPACRRQAPVLPRQVAMSAQPCEALAPWTFETSSFAGFSRDAEETFARCFDRDWSLTKLSQFLKSPSDQELLRDYLRPRYGQILAAWGQAAFHRFTSARAPAGVTMSSFREVLLNCTRMDASAGDSSEPMLPRGRSSWLLGPGGLLPSDVDAVFIAAKFVCCAKARELSLHGLAEGSLARFQFLEAVVRVSLRHSIGHLVGKGELGQERDPTMAVRTFLERSGLGRQELEQRRSLHANLFNEDFCLAYQEYRGVLEEIYEGYRSIHTYPGRGQLASTKDAGMTFGAWMQLLEDAGPVAPDGTEAFSAAFMLGKEIAVDNVTTMRHMELSFTEFLVALGMLVWLRQDARKRIYGEVLSDFFEELIEAVAQAAKAAKGLLLRQCESSEGPLVAFLVHAFQAADEDASGHLSLNEFRRSFSQPWVQEQLKDLSGFEIGEVDLLFRLVDRDKNRQATLDELVEAFVKMRAQMKTQEQTIAYFRQLFASHDKDSSGSLDFDEFQDMLTAPNTVRKLQSLGVSFDDIDLFFEDISLDGSSADGGAAYVTAEQMVATFLRIQDPGLSGERGLTFMRQVFLEADKDNNGSLNLDEIMQACCTDQVTEKLRRFCLAVPMWKEILDEVDQDGDGEMSWSELRMGLAALWETDLEAPGTGWYASDT